MHGGQQMMPQAGWMPQTGGMPQQMNQVFRGEMPQTGGMIPGNGMNMSGMTGMNGMIPVIADGVNTFQLTPMMTPAMPPGMQAFHGPLRGTRQSHRTGSGFNSIGYDTTDGCTFQTNQRAVTEIPITYNAST